MRRLRLTNCTISSWDCLIPGTKALTRSNLAFTHPSSNPTTSQLPYILKSNPLLSLSWDAVPADDGHMSTRAPLRHLRWLTLAGDSRHILTLLHRLEHPVIPDQLDIALHGCTLTEISETIGPHFENHFQRRGSSQADWDLTSNVRTASYSMWVVWLVRAQVACGWRKLRSSWHLYGSGNSSMEEREGGRHF